MGKILLRSFLRQNDGSFTPLANWRGPVQDLEYIQGAIELRINDKLFMGQEVWDDINWMWPYLVNFVEEVNEGGQGCFYFPDQPIKIEGHLLKNRETLQISIDHPEPICLTSDWPAFARCALDGADEFYQHMCIEDPRLLARFDHEIKRINRFRLRRHL